MTQVPPVNQFFRAMQAGSSHLGEMMELFVDDAVYIEPFSGIKRTHRGKAAIRKTMEDGWTQPLPDMKIVVERVHVDGNTVLADWVCYASVIPGGAGRGTNKFVLKNGRIAVLETTFREKEN